MLGVAHAWRQDFLWLKIYRESKIEKKHKTYFFEIFLQEIEYVL
jgi:hypothetical protein